jgi:endonuclease YncB( thermonuclease family)
MYRFCNSLFCNRKIIRVPLENITNNNITLYSLNGVKTRAKIVDIYDGDTCKIVIDYDNKYIKYNCRLNGIDTPEIKPLLSKINRHQEILNAYKAKNRLIQLSTNCNIDINKKLSKIECINLIDSNKKIIYIECFNFDKYGRLLVNIYENKNDKLSINQILVNEGYAKKYDGGTKNEFLY